MAFFKTLANISPLPRSAEALAKAKQGLFLEFTILSTNICAALPLK
jgi:hypothetical protein